MRQDDIDRRGHRLGRAEATGLDALELVQALHELPVEMPFVTGNLRQRR